MLLSITLPENNITWIAATYVKGNLRVFFPGEEISISRRRYYRLCKNRVLLLKEKGFHEAYFHPAGNVFFHGGDNLIFLSAGSGRRK